MASLKIDLYRARRDDPCAYMGPGYWYAGGGREMTAMFCAREFNRLLKVKHGTKRLTLAVRNRDPKQSGWIKVRAEWCDLGLDLVGASRTRADIDLLDSACMLARRAGLISGIIGSAALWARVIP